MQLIILLFVIVFYCEANKDVKKVNQKCKKKIIIINYRTKHVSWCNQIKHFPYTSFSNIKSQITIFMANWEI